jgi:hypothetical protein
LDSKEDHGGSFLAIREVSGGQMAEEAVVLLLVPNDGAGPIAGVSGALQLDILAELLISALARSVVKLGSAVFLNDANRPKFCPGS